MKVLGRPRKTRTIKEWIEKQTPEGLVQRDYGDAQKRYCTEEKLYKDSDIANQVYLLLYVTKYIYNTNNRRRQRTIKKRRRLCDD